MLLPLVLSFILASPKDSLKVDHLGRQARFILEAEAVLSNFVGRLNGRGLGERSIKGGSDLVTKPLLRGEAVGEQQARMYKDIVPLLLVVALEEDLVIRVAGRGQPDEGGERQTRRHATAVVLARRDEADTH